MVSISGIKRQSTALLKKLTKPGSVFGPSMTSFQCNVCGSSNCLPSKQLIREDGHCVNCQCYGRLRSIVYAVSKRFSPNEIVLARMNPRKDIRGLGCSDWPLGYVDLLAKKFDYVNTFYDEEPQLDLFNVDWSRWKANSIDFITCTDVLEHVEPPIEKVFENIYRLLKPGGAAVISVPTTLDPSTREHFPNLNDWKIVEDDTKRVLVNTLPDGTVEQFENLCFHGGVGMTLEFRYFSRQGLIENVEQAGLRVAEIHEESIPAHAIPLGENNFVLVAEKPVY